MLENQFQLTADEQHRMETFNSLAPEEPTNPLLADRGKRYGAFAENARISQVLKAQMRACQKWPQLDSDMKEALEMIAHKISRILAGDPRYDDSWIDIAGYATRVADRLTLLKSTL